VQNEKRATQGKTGGNGEACLQKGKNISSTRKELVGWQLLESDWRKYYQQITKYDAINWPSCQDENSQNSDFERL
jgi:hypothetical protein